MVMFKSLVSSTDQDTNQANQGGDNSVVTRILKVIQEEPSLSQKRLQMSLEKNIVQLSIIWNL